MSWFDVTAVTTTFVPPLVIFGPPGAIPAFLELTNGLGPRGKASAARRASLDTLAGGEGTVVPH